MQLGFKHCRPILGFDGCHIKGHHTGQLLTAIGIDANNSIFHVAYAVVESECKASWTWFLTFMEADLDIVNDNHWTFISDKQKGLQEAISGMWQEGSVQAEHRHCARHLQSNMTKVSDVLILFLLNIFFLTLCTFKYTRFKYFVGTKRVVCKDKDDGRGYDIFEA